jgi:hypothetical protein
MRAFLYLLAILVAVSAWLSTLGSPATAETLQFGPFRTDNSRPDVIELNGELDSGSALAFRRALNAAPNAKLLTLRSDGGLVSMGLLIADDVFQRKMATFIPADAHCFSACSFIFLAGSERKVDGKLGVHQISSDLPDLTSAQLSISDIIDVLNRFGTSMDVLTIMFRTPADDMYVFSPEEIAKFGINRQAALAGSQPPAPLGLPSGSTSPSELPAVPELPALPTPSEMAKLSVIEDYARRPSRMALYTGLDFAGEDLDSLAVRDAAACATSCLQMKACKAFTFNVTTREGRGPNCFLKRERGQLDGNSAAISGEMLSRSDPAPAALTVGAIDPGSALHKDVDLVGSDLTRKPYSRAKTPRDCRLACVANDRCRAFTYVQSKRECWLKSGSGEPRLAAGMTSGIKATTTFEPAMVIDLEQ